MMKKNIYNINVSFKNMLYWIFVWFIFPILYISGWYDYEICKSCADKLKESIEKVIR